MLQLEYICTEAEMREAQSLGLRQQLGKGSRVRTNLILFGMLAGALTLLYLQMRTEVPPKYRPWYLVFVAAVFFFFFCYKKFARRKPGKATKVELSDREITVINDGTRVATQWSGFSECLESANLFVLVDRLRIYLLIFPKRVFPDDRSKVWFRTLASQRSSVAPATGDAPITHGVSAPADGIELKFRLGYCDYLNRLIVSWRIKGMVVALFIFLTGMTLYMGAQPDPERVNSPAKVYFVFELPIYSAMLLVIMPVVALISWRSEKKYLTPRHLVLSRERIDFAGSDGGGFAAWTTYKYWLENRWCFVIWNPQVRQWDMFPKRAFLSPADTEKCRMLLQQNLKRSRWFFY